jgi:glycosyltransferase involved in cell wall biosynthesis
MSLCVRILTVANHLGARGGLERTQLTNCRALARRGHQLDLVYVSAGDFADEWRAFVASMTAVGGTLPRRRRPLASLRALGRAVRAGVGCRPDVVYVYRYWDLPYAVVVGRLAGAPVVFHLCLPPPGSIPWWLRAALRRVRSTLAVSRDTAAHWAGTGLDVGRTRVVLTGVDLDRYRPAVAADRAQTRAEAGLPDDAFVVLYAGRIGREKGVDVLVQAAHTVHDAAPDCRILIVGSPSLGADPQDSARSGAELHDLADGVPVTWLPARPDVVSLIQACDVAVAPSLWPEPLSRSVMEPVACGVPVVATRVGGNPEILTDWLSSFLVEPANPDDLAARVLSLRDWRTRDGDLATRLRAYAETHLSLEDETAAVEAALAEACAQPARRRRMASPSDATSCG